MNISPAQHQRRVLLVEHGGWNESAQDYGRDEFLSYCVACQWYQQGDLPTVMSRWATHLDEMGIEWRKDQEGGGLPT